MYTKLSRSTETKCVNPTICCNNKIINIKNNNNNNFNLYIKFHENSHVKCINFYDWKKEIKFCETCKSWPLIKIDVSFSNSKNLLQFFTNYGYMLKQ